MPLDPIYTFESGIEEFAANGAGVTVTQSTEQAHGGSNSLKVVTDGASGFQGADRAFGVGGSGHPFSAGRIATWGIWIFGTAGHSFLIGWDEYTQGFASYLRSKSTTFSITSTNVWQYAEYTAQPGSDALAMSCKVVTNGTFARTWYLDDAAIYFDPAPTLNTLVRSYLRS